MISQEAAAVAAQCRHYAMCKIDFLGTGLCPAARENPYVSYYPQGRMDICQALAAGNLPVTERLVDIARSCTLCGICDKQCYFVSQLRPMLVARQLKQYVQDHLEQKKPVLRPETDEILERLREIVGERFAANDPAILIAYAKDPCPVAPQRLPRYVVLPGTREEIVAIMKLCRSRGLPFAIRGNGSSVMGFVMSEGLVVDLNRMKRIEIDRENWLARVEPGVSSFELQQAALQHGLRVNAAEPAALMAANIMCSGLFSLFSASYGICASNIVTAEFVDGAGRVYDLNEKDAPNLFSFQKTEAAPPGICTRLSVKLYPLLPDEEGVLVPFADLASALALAADLSRRRIGTAIGILGGEYLSTFMAPSVELAFKAKEIVTTKLGIKYLVLVIADTYGRDAVRRLAKVVIPQKVFATLMLGFPNLPDNQMIDLLDDFSGDRAPYELLGDEKMLSLLELALAPSPATLAGAFPEDLRDFFAGVYENEKMSDLVWLNSFRILSSRLGRHKHAVAFILFVPLDEPGLVLEIESEFKRIGDRHGVHNDYGFITPLDQGKRAVFEYDFYLDHTREDEIERMQGAIQAAAGMIEGFSARRPAVKWIRYLLYQGICRQENFLYA